MCELISVENFKEYMKKEGYISLKLNNSVVISSLLDELNIKDYHDDFHVTLMYDERNPDINYYPDDKLYFAQVKGVDVLGEEDSEWRAISLILDSCNTLEKRHEELKKMGFIHSYDCYVPHISLKYKPSIRDIKIISDNIDKFKNLILVLGNETTEKIL